jgi:RNA polymerase sigma-70 factor (ECF subfamily)
MGTMSGQKLNLLDADRFAQLFNQTHLPVFRYIYGLHGGPQYEVEDLTAETFTRAWKARHRFVGDEDAALRWLIQIARNLVIDSSRRSKVRGTHHSIEDIGIHIHLHSRDLSPEEQIANQEQYKTLWLLLKNLPYQQREMLILRYMLGWQVKQIASHLDMAENTVSVYLRRILMRLRKEWPEN